MSSDGDNALKDVDLSAWDVPPPETTADDLADSVIARLGGTEVGAAVPVEEPMGARKRALLIAGVAAAVIAVVVGAWAIVRGTDKAAPVDGAVIAEKAQTLDLDGARAELDAGAEIRWSRKGSVLRVEQRSGNASWRVGTDSKLVIDAGAASASVEATGASLRVEVRPMNAADFKIAGAVASTAAVVAMVTVVVYEGHVKVHDGGTQQTVIVQPGSTYTVQPAPPPITIVEDEATFAPDDPVVGVAPVGSDQPPEVRIVAGEDVVIHDMSPPTRVQVDMRKICRGTTQLVVNGVTTAGDTFAFNRGSVSYHVLCDDVDVARGSVVVTRDSLMRPMPSAPPMNSIRADGRTYKISFQSMPALEVSGGPGTLHVANGSQERTYEAKGDSVLIPSTDLAQGQYKIWFQPDKMSTVDIALDTSAPIISFTQIGWGPQVQLEGVVLDGATMSIDGVKFPAGTGGRFKALVPGDNGVLVLRVEHPSAGLHYAIARQTLASVTPSTPTPVTVAQKLPNTLDRVSIQRTMTMLKSKVLACAKTNPPKARGTVKVKVAVKPDGKVQTVDVAQGLEPMLDQCLADTIHATTFAPATQTTSFMYPIVVEVPTAAQLCDADLHKDKGIDNVNLGQYAAALSQFEASLRCKEDGHVLQLAFMSACKARNEPKATHYYTKLTPAQRQKFAQVCVRNNIDPSGGINASNSSSDTDLAVLRKDCNADALKDKGMELVNAGKHHEALRMFEQSAACKEDTYTIALAFLSACNSKNDAKARTYYAKLTATQQSKYKVMCDRNGIDLTSAAAGDTDDVFADSTQKGYLRVNSKPNGKILIDGVDTGLTTPITGKQLALTPGKHKVTFVIGDDRFTYPVLIQPGKTETMSKDLR
jgi:hypothetical protein